MVRIDNKACTAAQGHTLVELVVALGLAALLICLALPTYGDWIATSEIMNEAQHLAGSLETGRAPKPSMVACG